MNDINAKPIEPKVIAREIIPPKGLLKTVIYTDTSSKKVKLTDKELTDRAVRMIGVPPKKVPITEENAPKDMYVPKNVKSTLFVTVTKEDIDYYAKHYGTDTVCPCCLHEYKPEDFQLQPFKPTEASVKSREAWLKLAEGELLECPPQKPKSRTNVLFTFGQKLWKFCQLDKLAGILRIKSRG